MKRILLGASALIALAVAAQPAAAADLPRGPAMVAKAPIALPYYNWTGFYIGINGGGGWGKSRQTDVLGVSTGTYDVDGGMIGGTVGYNLQTGPWVWGLEADLDWANVKGSTTIAGATYTTDLRWQGTARGRIGYAFDRVLPYLTGGLALGGVHASANLPPEYTSSKTRLGYALGGGVEFAIAPNWSAKAEYLYVDLGSSQTINTPATIDHVRFDAHEIRAGVNYKFGGPVVARY